MKSNKIKVESKGIQFLKNSFHDYNFIKISFNDINKIKLDFYTKMKILMVG